MDPIDAQQLRRLTRRIPTIFIRGLLAVLPILVTVGVVLWVLDLVEGVFGEALKLLLPDGWYGPGMGLFFGLIVVFVVGAMTRAIFFRETAQWLEERLERIPLINTVYGAVRDLTGLFAKKDSQSQFNKPVMVKLPNLPFELVGFVTVESMDGAPFEAGVDSVAVYLPMSYQIGGYTIVLDRAMLRPLEMSFEDAMRFVVTAGMSRKVPGDDVVVTPADTPVRSPDVPTAKAPVVVAPVVSSQAAPRISSSAG